MEAAATPLRGLEANYSFGYTDAAYTSLKVPDDGSEADLKGHKQIFTPDVTSLLALQYSYRLSSANDWQLVVRGEWMYVGKQYFDLKNTLDQEGYHLLNTRAGLVSRHIDILFWMRNITDRRYIAYAYDFGAVHLGNPRMLGITLAGRL